MAIPFSTAHVPRRILDFPATPPLNPSRVFLRPPHCTPVAQQIEYSGILCEPCGGRGWLVCDFCKGQKTNVQSETKRIYRRCPSCRAIGYLLCGKCKVFKCVTYPNADD